MANSKKVVFGSGSTKPEDLISLTEPVEAGQITLVIDRRYPLEQIIDAHRYVETGHIREM